MDEITHIFLSLSLIFLFTKVVIDDLSKEGTFMDDRYLLESLSSSLPKSILCFPILHLNALLGEQISLYPSLSVCAYNNACENAAIPGCVYLENEEVTGAFKVERLWLMSVISSFMGISLSNASLYGELRERTAQLADTNTRLQVCFVVAVLACYFIHVHYGDRFT